MAGTILISLLIVSFAIITFSGFSNFAENFDIKNTEIEAKKFNENFEKYVGRTDITAQEIATTINYAKDSEYEIEIIAGTLRLNTDKTIADGTGDSDNEKILNFVEINNNSSIRSISATEKTVDFVTYSQTGIEYDNKYQNPLVNRIVFTKN